MTNSIYIGFFQAFLTELPPDSTGADNLFNTEDQFEKV